ncbi:DUF424 family protein [Candidatus Woesearchaeota archaeon]|nr:DUF424 family protein [Candidatus Woesearchaeota archaeon]
MRFIVAEKKTPHGILLVITDANLLGKKHEEENKQLDLANKFYLGEKKNEKEIATLLNTAYILHLTGTKAVELGVKSGLIDKRRTITIRGIPHAEAVLEK